MTATIDLFFSWDSLTIYDGGSITSPMMGKYCGTSIPPRQVSSSNEVLIKFHSDWSATESGFQMEYNPIGNTWIQNYWELWEYSSFSDDFFILKPSPFSHSNHINDPFRSIVFFCFISTEIYRVEQMGFNFYDYSGFSQNHPPQTFLDRVYNPKRRHWKIK